MAPQTLLAKVGLEALTGENERPESQKRSSSSSSTIPQQSCQYRYVPQHPIVHLVAPKECSANCCRSMVVGS
ncbi:hypothetical protein HanRHA438_Chr17g0792761 [Helianthus annuus]|nr:hypothetical protein HanRHA438_Chr17g0792761 [Helianthus annuus]